jgi:hypothetical protein
LLRSGNKPLHQIYNRVIEYEKNIPESKLKREIELKFEHQSGPVLDAVVTVNQFKVTKFPDFQLKISKGDNGCILSDGTPFVIANFIQTRSGNKLAVGKKLICCEPYYKAPCSSTFIGIKQSKKLSELVAISLTQIKQKCLLFLAADGFTVSIPLLHTDK